MRAAVPGPPGGTTRGVTAPAAGAPESTPDPSPAHAPEPTEPATDDLQTLAPTEATVSLDIEHGKRCSFRILADAFAEKGKVLVLHGVRKLETDPSEACEREVLWEPNGDVEKKAFDETFGALDQLQVGNLALEADLDPALVTSYDPTSELKDLDFDGYKDLCLLGQFHGFTSGSRGIFRCWVYSPEARRYIFKNELSGLDGMVPDPKTRRLRLHSRNGMLGWSDHTFVWEGGNLVEIEGIYTSFEDLEGRQAPAGKMWQLVHSRRDGKLVLTRRGLVAAPPRE